MLNIRKSESKKLTKTEIIDYIEEFKLKEFLEFSKNNQYYNGKNYTIENKLFPSDNSANNRISISYARKLVKTVVGYMFSPNLITYNFVDDNITKEVEKIFLRNREKLLNSQIGKDVSNYGVAYEYHFLDENSNIRFLKMDPKEIIPIWDYSIDPQLSFIIRFYQKNDKEMVFVYSKELIEEYELIEKNKKKDLILINTYKNFYNPFIPFNIYKN